MGVILAVEKLGGQKVVAEMTGRRARILSDGRGRGVFTLRALSESTEMDSLNVAEKGNLHLPVLHCSSSKTGTDLSNKVGLSVNLVLHS